MSITKYKGLLRNALVLAVKYLHMHRGDNTSYDNAQRVVKDFLEQNGFNFSAINYAENTVVRRIVQVAEDMEYDNLPIEEATAQLGKKLKIDLI